MATGDDINHVGARLTTLQLCALYRRTIEVTCPCGHVRRFDAVALWWLYERRGWETGCRAPVAGSTAKRAW